jgi:hypothetical protein
VGCIPSPSKLQCLKAGFLDAMISSVLRDLPFGQNQPQKLDED